LSLKTIVAIILIALGIVLVGYTGITYTTRGEPIDFLGVHIETTKRHVVPPVAGAIILVGGIVVLATRTKKD